MLGSYIHTRLSLIGSFVIVSSAPPQMPAERTEEEEGEDTKYPRQEFEEKSLSDSEIKVQRRV